MRRAPFTPKPSPELPYRLIWKEIHGQLVRVKVYQAAWARGSTRQSETLGLKKRSPGKPK